MCEVWAEEGVALKMGCLGVPDEEREALVRQRMHRHKMLNRARAHDGRKVSWLGEKTNTIMRPRNKGRAQSVTQPLSPSTTSCSSICIYSPTDVVDMPSMSSSSSAWATASSASSELSRWSRPGVVVEDISEVSAARAAKVVGRLLRAFSGVGERMKAAGSSKRSGPVRGTAFGIARPVRLARGGERTKYVSLGT